MFNFGYKTSHQSIGNGRTYPDLGEQIVGVFVDGLQIDGDVVEYGNERIDDENHPEVAFGVALPFLACIEEGERAEQQHREGKTQQMECVESQGWRKENIA